MKFNDTYHSHIRIFDLRQRNIHFFSLMVSMFSLYTVVIVAVSLAISYAATCTVGRVTGRCVDVSTCTGTSIDGKCPGAPNIQCCIQNDTLSSTNAIEYRCLFHEICLLNRLGLYWSYEL